MKSILALGVAVMFSAAGMAQQRGHQGANAPPLVGKSYPAVGGALPLVRPGPPGVVSPVKIVNPFSGSVPFPQRLGATISGFPSYTGAPSGAGRRGHHHRGFFGYGGYPLLYPVFGPLGVTYDQPAEMAAPQDQAGPSTAAYEEYPEQSGPAEERPPSQSFTAPSPERPEPPRDQPLFFIALTDNSVYTAVAYWVEQGTLNYITPQGEHNQVSLSLIDRDTTDRLNRGSKFQIHLPAA